MLQAGQKLGEVEVAAQVASGGMATLFVGRRMGRSVAIKLLHEHLSQDWEIMRMFIDEALISIRLRHPNIVRVDELGELDGRYYLVMEYVHGCSLAELLAALQRRGRRLDPGLALWIAGEVGKALHATHELAAEDGSPLGVVHRDVSPQNVLISHHGEVKLTDFGIAKASGRAERHKAGEVQGKFRYMAPEQLGENQDRRVDIFALGVVLWEMLSQRRLRTNLPQGDSLAEAIRNPVIPAPSEHTPGLPENIDHIVAVSTAADPNERPDTAAALASALEAEVSPEGCCPTPRPELQLSALVRELLGPKLLDSAQRLPKDMASALALDELEVTTPRGDPSGIVAIPQGRERQRPGDSQEPVFELGERNKPTWPVPRQSPPTETPASQDTKSAILYGLAFVCIAAVVILATYLMD